ncbi:Alpha/Beta hydrolase protein [Dactylonectria estremocensis]|uniref:Alpha/Beta hydrolase protein n=1 Tax=Dactylonectria estremocensis TaxID=1079267 RepID=A0A9P9F5Z8_9HYPO|nr:Alpha/Beta hydrolase protein [Dactylonectria estremocensis]
MRRLFHIPNSNPVASAPAATASTPIPSSGLTFIDNSQGASAAATELSTVLESALEQVDFSGDLNAQLKQLLHQLDSEASKYCNSKITNEDSGIDWKCSQAKAQLVSIAWKCAHGTYKSHNGIVNTAEYSVQSDHVAAPSLGGSIKAWTSTVVRPATNLTAPNEFLPILVIAIRGSASKMDHVVNANERPRAAGYFIDPNMTHGSEIFAHAGFLNSAEALDESVAQRIQSYVTFEDVKKKHVLFTGHSAGGAVASLLSLRYLSTGKFSEAASFSCINFGSPPSVSVPVDLARYQAFDKATVALSIINEFDLVSRADRPYIMTLANLIRSIYGKSPLPIHEEMPSIASDTLDNSPVHPSWPKNTVTTDAPDNPNKRSRPVEGTAWPVPRLFYHHVGSRIVLLMRLESDDIRLRAVEVPSSEFEKLLFCRIAVHSGRRYSERVQLLKDGLFNHHTGWT